MMTFLAFDLGAESGRALSGIFDGNRLTVEQLHRFPNRPVWVRDSLHWDVLALYVDSIHIVGGGSQNHLLCQFTADACGLPVVAGPVEATAMGNLLVQMMAAGLLSDRAEARDVVRASVIVEHYEARDRAAWDDAYDRFRRLVAKDSP